MKNEVFVLGGTGFIGAYTVSELLKKGYNVSTAALPPLQEGFLPNNVEITLCNINDMSDDDVVKMLTGKHAFIFAAGKGDYGFVDKPANRFFYTEVTLSLQRLVRLARKAGMKKFILCGSFFCHFWREWPELVLEKSAYPLARILQEQIAFLEGEGAMDVVALRFPYILGSMNGHPSGSWMDFYYQIKGKDVIEVPAGGSTMVTVQQVAEVLVGAMENGEHGKAYLVGDANLKFAEATQIMLDEMGQSNTQIKILSEEQYMSQMKEIDDRFASQGREAGIHMVTMAKVLSRDTFVDLDATRPVLGYKRDSIETWIRNTTRDCMEQDK